MNAHNSNINVRQIAQKLYMVVEQKLDKGVDDDCISEMNAQKAGGKSLKTCLVFYYQDFWDVAGSIFLLKSSNHWKR